MMNCESSSLNNSALGELRNAEVTAAGNNDAGPPIFEAARYGTAGDLLLLPRNNTPPNKRAVDLAVRASF
jgi:hypothetical protein